MAEGGLVCRHCGRPIAVPASRCPWCDRKIMVVCAHCKQYTEDDQPTCRHCGQPLVADSREEVRRLIGLRPEVAELVADQQRAQLVASGVVALYLPGFFFDDGQQRTVLAELFGASPDNRRKAAALLFVAIAYLVEQGYCELRPASDARGLDWLETRPWDGQELSLEGALAAQTGLGLAVEQALDRAVRRLMGFEVEVTRPRLLQGGPRVPTVRNVSLHEALTAVLDAARTVVLPEHEERAACANTYRLLRAFVQADPDRARALAETILDVLDWFLRFQENPSLALMRQE
jgi:RNA polymerase subunit RPABC4/transcription elongation factor Spt4